MDDWSIGQSGEGHKRQDELREGWYGRASSVSWKLPRFVPDRER